MKAEDVVPGMKVVRVHPVTVDVTDGKMKMGSTYLVAAVHWEHTTTSKASWLVLDGIPGDIKWDPDYFEPSLSTERTFKLTFAVDFLITVDSEDAAAVVADEKGREMADALIDFTGASVILHSIEHANIGD